MQLFRQRPFLPQTLLFAGIACLIGILLTQISPLWVLAGLVGTAVVLLIIRYPVAGIGFALLAGPFGALESLFLGNQLFDSGQLLLLLTIGAWGMSQIHQKEIKIPRAAFVWPLFLFIGIALLSTLNAYSVPVALRELLKWLEIWLLIVIVVAEGARFEKRPFLYVQLIVGMFLFSGLVQALIGIWQFGLRGTGPEHFIIFGNYYRAYGSFEQPNPFGGLMHQSGLLAIGVLVVGLRPTWQAAQQLFNVLVRERRLIMPEGLIWWLFVGGCAGTAVLSLIFSWSRGAWLGFAAGAAVIGLFWPRQRWLGLLLLVGSLVLFVVGLQFDLLPASISDRLLGFAADFQLGDVRGVDINDANYAVLERLAHWQAALDMAKDHPWLGVGFGNYEPAYAQYALLNWPAPLGHAHNYYLNILAETGFLGFLAYLLFWGVIGWQTIVEINRHSGLWRGVLLGLLGCWVALSVHHLVDKLYVNNLYIQFGVLLGLFHCVRTQPTQKVD